jgi:beta-1,4-mannosyl-glycoprotein beta-1,4-N-acetylglucosaminyltransferase
VIVDVFMFDDDFDMLDCRLYELSGVVDRFIVIEGNTSFSGMPKPHYLWEARERYSAYPITCVQVDLNGPQPPEVPYRSWILPETAHAWVREGWQRNGAKELLEELDPDTWVIYGDVDEIPRRSALEAIVARDPYPGVVGLEMRLHIYSTSLMIPSAWAGSLVGKVRDLGTDVLFVRDLRWNFTRVPDGGWHLSWFGDPESRERKLTHHSHQELVAKVGGSIGESLPRMRVHVDGETALEPYSGNDFPRWVLDGRAPEHWTTKY